MTPEKNTIPFVSLNTKAKQPAVGDTLQAIAEIVKNSQFILGEAVPKFEGEFARLAGTKHGIGVNSGLDALILSLRALGVGPGYEVITAPNSFLATAAAIDLVGARTVFVDVGNDYNINPSLIEEAISPRTIAIMPVHLTGNPCRMDEIMEIARRRKLFVIEDAAQSVGATYNGKSVGGFGDAGAFSLHPLKNLHVWGDGGMVTTNSDEITSRLRLERNHGLKNRDEADFFSYNSRLDTIQAAVGLHHLPLLAETNQRRLLNAGIYEERLRHLADRVHLPEYERSKVRHVFHVFQVRTKQRDALKENLQEKGIETKIHYPIPIHWQKAASHLGYRKGDFPVTDRLAKEILSLPVRESLATDEVHRVCDAVDAFFKS